MRQLLTVSAVLVAAAASIAAYETTALRAFEQPTVDLRFAVRGAERPPNDVAVVAIDASTLNQLRLQWPFPRSLHARVIDTLKRDGARAIAYDIQFTQPSQPAQDLALYNAIARAGNVVLGTTEVGPHGSTNVLGGDASLNAAHAVAGNANYAVDRGAVIRKFPYAIDGLRSFAVQAVTVATGRPVSRTLFDGGSAWIDYVGGPRRVPTVPYWKVLEGSAPAAAFRGKVVVVGATEPSLQDIHGTPTSNAMSGPEIQANAIHTLLRNVPLRTISPAAVDVALIVLLAAIPALLILLLPLTAAVIGCLAAGAAYAVGAQLIFDSGRIVTFVYPLLALTITTVAAIVVSYFTEIRERLRTRNAFKRFIPADVVDQVLAKTDDELRLGGIEAEGTVMFSDVRGFTTFSESSQPARVIEILNRYLSEMTEAILGHGGTLVAYMGDGIMAVFGAPLAQPDHADRAVAAACEMLTVRLERFNKWAREQGIGDGFQMGVGLNSGSFISGNVGSLQRLEYTVIGDTTNTAARLEGMTKGTGHSLFVADSTHALLSAAAPPLELVGDLEVRGRTATIRVWGLASANRGDAPTGADREPAADDSAERWAPA